MIKYIPVTIFGLILFGLITPCWADLARQRTQLDKINARIERAETDLQNKKQSELNISRELVLIKKMVVQINQRVAELKTDLKKLRGEIDQQHQSVRESQQGVKKIALRLKKRLVALYKEGETGSLKILFSADSPTEMVQQYHYLTRVLQYDRELLEEYRQAIQIQQQHLVSLESLEQQQAELLEKEKQQQRVAEKGRKLQARLLKQARTAKKKLAHELAQLEENATRLKTLINRLEQEPVSPMTSGASHFAVGQGKLGWPVNGRVIIGFGQQQDSKLGTYYESNGIEIATPTGSPIRAVAAGKIVFADYFKGYGNLFILSHPGGFHTLYAQTDRMQKKSGEQVAAGTVLGYSGLGDRDSIYFEIRAKGAPVNPLSWLKRQ